jgi:hypothetical protein
MLVIVDADSWVERSEVLTGIRRAAEKEHLVVPWWNASRLNEDDSETIMGTDPTGPLPVSEVMRKASAGTGPSPASAAMVLCLQRISYERVGGMDPRFRGWGSEDVSFGLACWTLLGRNEYTIGEAYALYHPRPERDDGMRVWDHDPGMLNMPLYERYAEAQGRPDLMVAICQEHPVGPTPVGTAPTLTLDDLTVMPGYDKLITAPIVRQT